MERSGELSHYFIKIRVFFGEFSISFSKQKKRLALPAKIRQQIAGGEVILTRGFEKCVLGYARNEWEKSAKKQIEIPITEKRGRKIRRYLFSGAMIGDYDSQGRMVIPQSLVDYANLGNPTIIIGAGDHFEIWNKNKWEKYLEKINSEEI